MRLDPPVITTTPTLVWLTDLTAAAALVVRGGVEPPPTFRFAVCTSVYIGHLNHGIDTGVA